MISLTRFFIEAALVVAAVLVFSFFDPFGMFASKKLKLKDTPITVESIKGIGKFISAEYYGEVLSSLNEIYIDKLDSNKNVFKSLDSSFAVAINEMKGADKKIRNKNKLVDFFHDQYPGVTNNPFYPAYLDYLREKYGGQEKNVLDKLVDGKKELAPFDQNMFSKLKKENREYFSATKKSLKQQIVLLGRGSVKAGFDFEKFTPENFRYIASEGRVYLIGMEPQILSCDINPWFIPQKKIKGFDIVLYTGKANDPKKMNDVKEDCLAKLRQSAIDADILDKAKENAIQNLKTFFSLLVDQEINDVVFAADMLEVYRDEILADSVIKGEELFIIDTIISKADNQTLGGDTNRTFPRVQDTLDILRDRKFYFRKEPSTLNIYSSIAYNITADWTVDSSELVYLQALKADTLPIEQYWFHEKDSTSRVELKKEMFVNAVDEIRKNTNSLIKDSNGKVNLNRNDSKNGKNNSITIDSILNALKN